LALIAFRIARAIFSARPSGCIWDFSCAAQLKWTKTETSICWGWRVGLIENRPLRSYPVRQAALGPDWVHEIKHDGYRLIVRRDGKAVRLSTRRGHDWTDRYPSIAGGGAILRARSWRQWRRHVRRPPPVRRVTNAILQAFDLLELDGSIIGRCRSAGERIAWHGSWPACRSGSRYRWQGRAGVPAGLRYGPRRHRIEAGFLLCLRVGVPLGDVILQRRCGRVGLLGLALRARLRGHRISGLVVVTRSRREQLHNAWRLPFRIQLVHARDADVTSLI
jgi:hypothetical protein